MGLVKSVENLKKTKKLTFPLLRGIPFVWIPLSWDSPPPSPSRHKLNHKLFLGLNLPVFRLELYHHLFWFLEFQIQTRTTLLAFLNLQLVDSSYWNLSVSIITWANSLSIYLSSIHLSTCHWFYFSGECDQHRKKHAKN